jgi:hypothetical protein
MKQIKRGQIVKFHTPNEDENPKEIYVVLDYIEDGERSRAQIKPLNTKLSFPPISLVLSNDLVIGEVQTFQLEYYLEYGNHGLF